MALIQAPKAVQDFIMIVLEVLAEWYQWARSRLVLMLVCAFAILQFLTWRAVVDVANNLPRNPPSCSSYDPCAVSIDERTIKRLQPK
jgi:hypothetical protein